MILLQRGAAKYSHNPNGTHTQRITLQQSFASTAKGTQSLPTRVQARVQPQSPDLNITDLGLSASLKSRVWAERYGAVDELVEGISSMSHVYDTNTLEKVWHRLFKRYNQVLRTLGGMEFEVEHAGTKERQREDGLARLANVDRAASPTALDWWVDGVE